MWMWILISLDIITKVHGFANGNFPQSCNSLSPQHPIGNGSDFSAQTSEAPFMVDFERRTNPEDPITVVLRSNESTEFRGFMLEVVPADSGPLNGRFISLDTTTTRLLTCNGLADSAVSQRNNQRKSLFRVNWTAPEINQDIVFRATFVQDFVVFWENVRSTFSLLTTTPAPGTTTNTPEPSTTTNTPEPSTTTNTPEPSTTTNTPEPSTTTNSPAPNTTTNSLERSTTTNTSTLRPTTVTPAPSTTENSPTPSTTTNTSTPITPTKPPTPCPGLLTKVGTALMWVDIIFEEVKMEMSNIFAVLMAKGAHCHRLSEVSKTVLGTLCLGIEIVSLILFALGSSCNEILVGLTCVVIVINFTEQVIWALTVRRKLEKCGIITGKVCFVVHQSFTLAILYVVILVCCGKNWGVRWFLNVLIALTVWIFLSVVWILGFSTQKIEKANEKGPLQSWQQNRSQQIHSQQKQKSHTAAQVIVSALVIIGTTSLAVAVIVGIFVSQEN